MIKIPEDKQLILFDGVCNLCNSSVQIIIKNDSNDKFLFAPLQGKAGKQIIDEYKIDTNEVDSILLFSKDFGVVSKSTAVLKIAKNLKFPWNLSRIFVILPKRLRDSIYDLVARKRYKWFGRQNECMIPTPELKSKFLE